MQKRNLFLLFFFTTILFSGFYLHPFHVSKSDIKYNESQNTIEIAIHIFIDDLEASIKKQSGEKLYLATPKEASKSNDWVSDYVQNNFKLKINGTSTILDFVGKDYSEDKLAIWCYFEAKNIQNIKEITLKNTILFDLYDDQKNIVHIIGPNNQKIHFLHQIDRPIESKKF